MSNAWTTHTLSKRHQGILERQVCTDWQLYSLSWDQGRNEKVQEEVGEGFYTCDRVNKGIDNEDRHRGNTPSSTHCQVTARNAGSQNVLLWRLPYSEDSKEFKVVGGGENQNWSLPPDKALWTQTDYKIFNTWVVQGRPGTGMYCSVLTSSNMV